MGEYIPPPFGILTLAAYLEAHVNNVEIEVVDCQAEGLDWDGLEKRIESLRPDIVAPSGLSTSNAYTVLRTVDHPDIQVGDDWAVRLHAEPDGAGIFYAPVRDGHHVPIPGDGRPNHSDRPSRQHHLGEDKGGARPRREVRGRVQGIQEENALPDSPLWFSSQGCQRSDLVR